MTNSGLRRKAIAIIDEVFEKTSEDYLQSRIDDLIGKAAVSFEFDRDAPITHQYFIRVIVDFIRHVYEKGLGVKQELTFVQALAEVMGILKEIYQNSMDRDYDAAFLNASNPEIGLEYVLGQITTYLIVAARVKHIRWICTSRMEMRDWPLRCMMAEILIERLKLSPPENIGECSPCQFADCLPELIITGLSANKTINKIFSTNS